MHWILPLSAYPYQIFSVSVSPDGIDLIARIEIRYMTITDQWVLSIWDASADELLVSQIPLICSYEKINDLLYPFRYLREGRGLGSLFCLKDSDPTTQDPAKDNLLSFQLVWGDMVPDELLI